MSRIKFDFDIDIDDDDDIDADVHEECRAVQYLSRHLLLNLEGKRSLMSNFVAGKVWRMWLFTISDWEATGPLIVRDPFTCRLLLPHQGI